MTFVDKIDKLLIIRAKEFASIEDLERKCQIGKKTLRKAYNENREPLTPTLVKLTDGLGVTVEDWMRGIIVKNGEKGTYDREPQLRQINPYVIHVPLVGQYAHAGYLSGYSDEGYMEALPKVTFNIERDPKGNYVAFEVTGDSMDDGTKESYEAGYLLLCRELDRKHWRDRLHFKQYDFVLVHKTEGIVLKRIVAHNTETGEIAVHSLNPLYQDDIFSLNDITQIFNVVKSERSRKRG